MPSPSSSTINARERWYAVVLLFTSEIDSLVHLRPLCEERVVLFRGANQDDITRQSQEYGLAEQHSYKNERGQEVRWRFHQILTIDELEDPATDAGWEVASRFSRRSLRALRRGVSHS